MTIESIVTLCSLQLHKIIPRTRERLLSLVRVRAGVGLRIIRMRNQTVIRVISSHGNRSTTRLTAVIPSNNEQNRLERVGWVQHREPSVNTERTALIGKLRLVSLLQLSKGSTAMAVLVHLPRIGEAEKESQGNHLDADDQVRDTNVNISVGELVSGLEDVSVTKDYEDDLQ